MTTYKVNENQYPSVTTILDILDKPALIPWAAKLVCEYISKTIQPDTTYTTEQLEEIIVSAKKNWRDVSQEALDIGSEIHTLIEQYIKHGKDAIGEMKSEVENGFLAFLQWEQENIEKWLHSEMTVVEENLCYAGTLDAIAVMKDGKKYVIDFKSSKGFYDGYAEQIAAYRLAAPEEVDGMGVLRLDKTTGLPEWKDYSKQYESKLNAFIKLLDYWYAAKKRRCKNPRTVK